MNQAVEAFLDDVWAELSTVYEKESKRIKDLKNRSRLQAGIMTYLRVAWRKGKLTWADGRIHIDVYEPFSWSDSSYQVEAGAYITELSDELLSKEFFPALCERMNHLLHSDELGPLFFDYRFEVVFEFEREQSKLILKQQLLHETKLLQLQRALEQFVQSKINSDLPVLPSEDDMFFYAQHLVNPDLMKPEAEEIDPFISRLSNKLRNNQVRKDYWQRQCTSAFNHWAQEHFLPQYFNQTNDYGNKWVLKEEVVYPAEGDRELKFFLYAALQVGTTEPDARQRYLELAVQLGSKQAQDYMNIGSGKFENTYKGERVQARNNDITRMIEIRMLTEEEAAYGEALDYIINLLRQGFPKDYQLKLKSAQKHILPIKKLAKSKLHQFFAHALRYPALFPKIAEYADTAMEEFAWYRDVEPGEKSVMPGTYAVLGLGLYSEAYFPLVCRYMELVDTEHQMAHDDYAQAFIEAHGLKEEHMPVIVSILLGGNEEGRQVKNLTIDRPELAAALIRALQDKEHIERERVLYRVFGSVKKLAGAIKKAEPPLKEKLKELLALQASTS